MSDFIKTCLQCGTSFSPLGKKIGRKLYCSPTCTMLSRLKREGSGCWEWPGAVCYKGYGVIGEYGKLHRTHRLSYEHFKGSIPDGMLVCHTCDNPPCCNPSHLFLGTNLDNMADMRRKGRGYVPKVGLGSKHPLARLNEAEVLEIRALIDKGWPCREIAPLYGVHRTTISSIKFGQSWHHLQRT